MCGKEIDSNKWDSPTYYQYFYGNLNAAYPSLSSGDFVQTLVENSGYWILNRDTVLITKIFTTAQIFSGGGSKVFGKIQDYSSQLILYSTDAAPFSIPSNILSIYPNPEFDNTFLGSNMVAGGLQFLDVSKDLPMIDVVIPCSYINIQMFCQLLINDPTILNDVVQIRVVIEYRKAKN